MPSQKRYRFTTSWADKDFGYRFGQIVRFGKVYSPEEFPEAHGKKLLKSGILVEVE